MKTIEQGYLYKVNNVKTGRQTVRFYKKGVINDRVQEGTTPYELLKVIKDKLKFDNDKNYSLIENALKKWEE